MQMALLVNDLNRMLSPIAAHENYARFLRFLMRQPAQKLANPIWLVAQIHAKDLRAPLSEPANETRPKHAYAVVTCVLVQPYAGFRK